jgi:hypothetical protein
VVVIHTARSSARPGSYRGALAIFALLLAVAYPSIARAVASHVANWGTRGQKVVCGVTAAVPGTAFDPGTQAPLNGNWPGLQCMAAGIPRPRQGVGDPAVQLGQGRVGRARLVDVSQDELVSSGPYVELAPATTWKRDGITCAVHTASVRCTNSVGHGFTISPGHVHLF